jgi:hypothetical protein
VSPARAHPHLRGEVYRAVIELAAMGEEDALSLRYQSMRTAWKIAHGSLRPVPAGHQERVAAPQVDPTVGIVQTLLF